MSAPIIWFGNSARLLKSSLVIPGATSGALTLTAAAATTSYQLTMPAAQGANGDVLTNDGSGGLSWAPAGGSTPASFTIANNQTTPANVTGFLLNSANEHAFTSEYSIERTIAATSGGVEDTAFYTNLGTAFDAYVGALAQDASGRLLVGGSFSSFDGGSTAGLVRTSLSGVEDTAFSTALGTGFNTVVFGIAVQTDNKIVVGGAFSVLNGNAREKLVRLNDDGSEDTAFYTNLGTSFNSNVNTVVLQADGDILVGGAFTALNGSTRNRLVRLNSDGTEDTAFYTNLGTGFNAVIHAVVLQPDGDILVGGEFTDLNGNTRNRLVRLNSDGTEDTAFYTNLGTGFGGAIRSLAVQADGKIVVAGAFTSFNGNTRERIVRLNSDGTEDTAFYTNLGTSFDQLIFSVTLQATDSILVLGQFTDLNGNTRNRVASLNSDGTEDTAFYTNMGTGFNAAIFFRSLLLADDQLLIGGSFTALDGNTRNRLVLVTGGTPAVSLIDQGTLKGIFKNAAWQIGGESSFGDDPGVTLSITAGGQLQYTSTNIAGTIVTSEMKFLITRL